MITDISEGTSEIAALCRKHRVQELEVFGSAADGTFDPSKSDLDFLVHYFPLRSGEHYETYFGLLEGLESLFGRRIDLVDGTCLRNPYSIEAVNQSRTPVYDAESQEISET